MSFLKTGLCLSLLTSALVACSGLGPLTKERCESLPLKQMGFDDGKDGQRNGNRFDAWINNCEAFRVTLNRATYNEGYDQGLADYCSCKAGFISGAKDEFIEMKGQYYTCTRAKYKIFEEAQVAAKKLPKEPGWIKSKTSAETLYNHEPIEKAAIKFCEAAKL